MSGASLRYPLKPPQVCDDLESFVHVFNFSALRFHYTTLTDENTWNIRMRSSEYNSRLATFVQDFFYKEYKLGKYSYGGDFKFSVYKDSDAPFRLQQEGSTFTWLLDRLHELCYLHYKSLNREALERYSGKKERAPREPARFAVVEDKPTPLEAATTDIFPGVRASSTSASDVPTPSPLSDHKTILATFELAITGHRRHRWPDNDRTPVDQFLNLPGFDVVYDNNSITRSSVSVSGANTRLKHHRDPGDLEDVQMEAKRSKSESSKG